MSLRLVFHGGKCCGIKHIYGFDARPEAKHAPVAAVTFEKAWITSRNHDTNNSHVSSDLDFFTEEAPKETYEERLDRLITFCDKLRPGGIIEVVLVDSGWTGFDECNCGRRRSNCWDDCDCEYDYNDTQLSVWQPVLEKKGFKEVSSVCNSNSDDYIHIFHRKHEGED